MILYPGIHWFGILFMITTLSIAECFRIDPPTVLLAYNLGHPSNYTVRVNGAKPGDCFEWRSSNPRFIHITPIFHRKKCSKEAILSSLTTLHHAQTTQVFASLRGQMDKESIANVITDNVVQIEVEYVTDELVLGGPPQKLTMVGKDKRGHKFDSINGLEVQWNVVHLGEDTAELSEKKLDLAALSISGFDQSECVSSSNDLTRKRGGFNYQSVLAQPMQLGSATITASLLFSAKTALETQVTFNVVPNWRVYPSSSLYLLRHSAVTVKMGKVFDGKDEREEINKDDWKAEVENSDVILMSEDSSELYAENYGMSKISFQRTNKDRIKLDATYHVVSLARIGLRISHGDYKVIEERNIYEIFLDLFDENDNYIYPSDNLRFSLSFPTKLFYLIATSSNGTYAVAQAIAPGSGTIRYEYKGLLAEDGTIEKEFMVSSSTDVTIYQKLNIFPPQTILPLLSRNQTFYEVPLTVTGGSGNYAFSLSNCEMAKLVEKKQDKKTIILIEIYGEVDLLITATDKNNMNIITAAKISVQPPLDLQVYPTVAEAEIGNSIIIPAALLGYEDNEKKIIRKFDDCSKIQLQIDIIDPYVIAYESESQVPEFGKGCMSLQFRCKAAGHSRINIGYLLESRKNVNETHETTTLLACFKPLKPVQPVRVSVLALGTSIEVVFEGGPRKWPLHKDGHYTKLEASNPDIVKIQLIKDPVRYNRDLTVLRVTCLSLGENILKFKIGNHPSATIQHPASAEGSIKYICDEPHSLHLKLYKKNPNKKEKEKEKNIVKVPFYGEKVFAVDIWLKDAMGRKLANISSLRIVWDVSDKNLAEPESYFDFVTHDNAVAGYRKLTRNFKNFKMTGDTGKLTVEAKATTYRQDILSQEEIQNPKAIMEISNDIRLNLVSLRDLNYADAGEEDEVCENGSCTS